MEWEKKKAKQKKKTIAITAAVVIVVVAACILYNVNVSGNEIYTDGNAIVTLYKDGKFNTSLYHNEQYSGTYEKTADGDAVVFTYDGITLTAELVNNELLLPLEWDDDHGHGQGVLPKKQ
jgi:flagellar basal body-associated protein FliL